MRLPTTLHSLALGAALSAVTASAALLAPAPLTTALAHADSLPAVTGFIDSPTAGGVLAAGQPFTVSGWLVDPSAASTTGIDQITVSAQPDGQSPIPLGSATLSQPRPDVAQALNNPAWTDSGYQLTSPGLPAGAYQIDVSAHTASGWVTRAEPLTVGAAASSAAAAAGDVWTAYGYHVVAPSSVWPMLELLHREQFDWELSALSQRPTPIIWSSLPTGVLGGYEPQANVIHLSTALQSTSMEAGAAILAHEGSHLADDLAGRLSTYSGDACYATETRAFVNEANFWQMVFGPNGKPSPDAIEDQENWKMWSFAGNASFSNLVVRTTASYVAECGQSGLG